MSNTRASVVARAREFAPWVLPAIGCCRAALRHGQASRGARRILDRCHPPGRFPRLGVGRGKEGLGNLLRGSCPRSAAACGALPGASKSRPRPRDKRLSWQHRATGKTNSSWRVRGRGECNGGCNSRDRCHPRGKFPRRGVWGGGIRIARLTYDARLNMLNGMVRSFRSKDTEDLFQDRDVPRFRGMLHVVSCYISTVRVPCTTCKRRLEIDWKR